jgi:hypothetical protein
MSKVILELSVSLDGYVTGPDVQRRYALCPQELSPSAPGHVH